jgi:hypothetical protein
MSVVVLNGLRILAAVFFIFAAIASFRFWRRTRFWLPRYVHVLAGIAGAVMLLCVAGAPADAPARKQGLIANLLFVLLLPAIIYSLFILYGGQRAAYQRHFESPLPCPSCKLPVPARHDDGNTAVRGPSEIELKCPHCGQSFVSEVPAAPRKA